MGLNYTLLRNNASSVDARFLAVAIGSNASPGVMRREFEPHGESQVLPMLAGVLRGFGVGHSSHVSASGYIAAAPRRDPSGELPVIATLLDEGQLNRLDATEPNYRRRTCSAGLTLESGEQPTVFYLYDSKPGVLTQPGGVALPFGSQADLIASLNDQCPEFLELVGRRTGIPRSRLTDVSVLLPALGRDRHCTTNSSDCSAHSNGPRIADWRIFRPASPRYRTEERGRPGLTAACWASPLWNWASPLWNVERRVTPSIDRDSTASSSIRVTSSISTSSSMPSSGPRFTPAVTALWRVSSWTRNSQSARSMSTKLSAIPSGSSWASG